MVRSVLTIHNLLGSKMPGTDTASPASAARIIEASSLRYPYLEISLCWTDTPTIVAKEIPSLWGSVVVDVISDFVDVSGKALHSFIDGNPEVASTEITTSRKWTVETLTWPKTENLIFGTRH